MDQLAQFIDRYNSNLYIHMSALEFHDSLLPSDARTPDKLTLVEYLEFERERKKRGPFTVSDLWRIFGMVAHIKVNRTGWWRSDRFTAEPISVYKGSFPSRHRFRDGSWGQNYHSNTEYIVFWFLSDGVVFGQAMPFGTASGRVVVLYNGHGITFWPFEAELVAGKRQSQVDWSLFKTWLVQKQAGPAPVNQSL